MRLKLRILAALLRKEVRLMIHNPLIPKVVIMMPLMVMLIIPLVATLDVKNVNVVVVDNDMSQLSRRIIADINAADALNVNFVTQSHASAMTEIEKGDADVLLTIPYNYSTDMVSGKSAVDVEANGVNATKGLLGARYVTESVAATLSAFSRETGISLPNASPSIIYRYNQTLNFRNYMIPGLMVVLLIIICGFLPALNLVSEKETGTIEAMNVTPVSRTIFVLSKLIPFWVIAIIVVTIGMLIGRFVYGLAPEGNIGAIYLTTILFSLSMSGLGLTVANNSSTMLQTIFVMFAFIIIFQLMGGLFTPISSMPRWAQCITYFIPPRYFIEIMRSIYLKGASIAELWQQYLALTAFAIGLLSISAVTYKKRS